MGRDGSVTNSAFSAGAAWYAAWALPPRLFYTTGRKEMGNSPMKKLPVPPTHVNMERRGSRVAPLLVPTPPGPVAPTITTIRRDPPIAWGTIAPPVAPGAAMTPAMELSRTHLINTCANTASAQYHGWRFFHMLTPQVVPWTERVDGDAIPFDAGTAIFVGVSGIQQSAAHRYLMSDSFGPCVPVIIDAGDNILLHHSSGLGTVALLEGRKASLHGARIFLLNKTVGAPHVTLAAGMLRLELLSSAEKRNLPASVQIHVIDIPLHTKVSVLVDRINRSVVAFTEA
jgi:hypothetical protein